MVNIHVFNAKVMRQAILISLVFSLLLFGMLGYDYSCNPGGGMLNNHNKQQAEINPSGTTSQPLEEEDAPGRCYSGEVKAVKRWMLPNRLKEVSGITWIKDGLIAAIEDNHAVIYLYNLDSGKVVKELVFGGKGDFEGLAFANNHYYALRSDGMLFKVAASGKLQATYDLPLTSDDNTESLCYDSVNNRLLIGQKDSKTDALSRRFYAFNLSKHEFETRPVFKLELDNPIIACPHNNKKGEKHILRPSEICIHPITKELYVADGPNHRIIVLSADGNFVKYALQMNRKQFPQVEGLLFTPDGDFYVSTEGNKDPGSISQVAIHMD